MIPGLDALKAKFKPNLAFLDPAMNYLNSRNPREKIMIVALGGALVLAIDYLLILNPMVGVFMKITPKIGIERSVLAGLKDDKRNSAKIETEWTQFEAKLTEIDKRFVAPDSMPALLENLSQIASDSGIRITSLKPTESVKAETPGFARVPIRVNATGGGHELGQFLAKLENGGTFFKITNLRVTVDDNQPKRHLIEIDVEAYRKTG
jgi:type IV pilus assembly protein PilO